MNTSSRIQTLDILRGFSLFGVLIVNIRLFGMPQDKVWTGIGNHLATGWTLFIAEGKFYPIFSLLFGIGFIIQMQSAEQRSSNFTQLFGRRLVILFVFGVLHTILFSYFDILTQYACIGVALFLLRRRSPRFLFFAGIASLIIPYIIKVSSLLLTNNAPYPVEINDAVYRISIYGQGNIQDIFKQRFHDLLAYYRAFFDHTMYKIFAMFLFGAWIGKQRIFHNIPTYHTQIRTTMLYGLTTGLPGNILYSIITTRHIAVESSLLAASLKVLYAYSDLACATFYISAIALASQQRFWQPVLSLLANLGRMSLTTYIMQSVICTTIFYSYGFGLYGQVPPMYVLLIGCIIYVLQIAFSTLWFRYFRHGPLELVWRRLTYWNIPRTSR
jgi:uncharacterized protein